MMTQFIETSRNSCIAYINTLKNIIPMDQAAVKYLCLLNLLPLETTNVYLKWTPSEDSNIFLQYFSTYKMIWKPDLVYHLTHSYII